MVQLRPSHHLNLTLSFIQMVNLLHKISNLKQLISMKLFKDTMQCAVAKEPMGLFWRSALSVEFNYSTELYQILDFLTTKNCNFDLNITKCSKIYVNKSYNTLIKLRPALNLTGQPRWLLKSQFKTKVSWCTEFLMRSKDGHAQTKPKAALPDFMSCHTTWFIATIEAGRLDSGLA